MGNKKFLVLLALVLFFGGCVLPGQKNTKSTATPEATGTKTASANIKSVALVSLIVRNYGIYYNTGMMSPELINTNLNKVLSTTETTLGKYWKVKPVATFVANKTYQGFSKGTAPPDYFTPKVRGKAMPVFFTAGNDYIKGIISKDTAQKLCGTLGVDAIALVYSEWAVQTGKFVPTQKALTKNCVAMYDKNGKYLFFGRKDTLGSANIGSAYSGVHIDDKTIHFWLEAYEEGVKTVLDKEGKKL
jgi:hypothetical protein